MHPPKFSRWIDKQRTMGNFPSRRSTFNYRSLLENFGTRVGELAKILLEQLVKVEVTLRGILREDRRKREVWREGWKAYVVKFLSRSFIATKRISHEPGFTNRRVSKELSINVLNNNVRKLRICEPFASKRIHLSQNQGRSNKEKGRFVRLRKLSRPLSRTSTDDRKAGSD